MANGYAVLNTIAESPHPPLPVRKRKVTDAAVLFLFLCLCGAFIVSTGFGLAHGDPRRMFHGFDYRGKLCGVSADVAGMPLLYWPEIAEPKYPICVASCPSDASGTIMQPYDKVEKLTSGTTVITSISSAEKPVSTYASKEVAGKYCLPAHGAGELVLSQNKDTVTTLLSHVADLQTAFPMFIITIPLAFVLGWTYISACDRWGRTVLAVGFVCLVGLLIATSVYCFHLAATETGNIFRTDVAGDARTNEWWLGLLSACFAVFTLLMILLAMHTLNAATGVVHLACDVIEVMPSLLTLAIMEACSKLAWILGWFVLFSYVASIGDVERKEMKIDGKPLHGIGRRFHYSEEEIAMLIVYVIAGIWGVEVIGAISNFTTAYSVTLWYFTECDNDGVKPEVSSPVGKAFCVSIRNHLGSLSLGAVLIGPLGLLRTIIAYMADQGCAAAHGNQVSSTLCKPCMCCFQCFDRFLVLLSRNAYIEIAVHSDGFLKSAMTSMRVLAGTEFHEIAVLSGMTFVFSFLGTACISVFLGLLAFLCTTTLPWFTADDSAWFVASPVVVSVMTGIIACMVAAVFMSSFDMVADTVLYCTITDRLDEKSRPAGEPARRYAPSSLLRILHKHGRMQSRHARRTEGGMTAGQTQVREISSGRDKDAERARRELNKQPTKPFDEGHAPQMPGGTQYNPVTPGAKTRGIDVGQSKKPPESPKTVERQVSHDSNRSQSKGGVFQQGYDRIASMISGSSSASVASQGAQSTQSAIHQPDQGRSR